jgi:uncharacterized membrane protein
MPTHRTMSIAALAGLLATSATLHFLRPKPFISMVPRSLPRPDLLVAVSGAAELGCAALIAVPCLRPFGGVAAAIVFVAVFPANVSMAMRSGHRARWYQVIAWLRLPLQLPLVMWALRVARAQ